MSSVVRTADESDLNAVLAVGHRTWPATYPPITGEDYVATGPRAGTLVLWKLYVLPEAPDQVWMARRVEQR